MKLSYNEGRDTREFAKGLGTHSRCLLSFKIDSAYNIFAATIGIDAETQGRGDCVFVVLGDGKELYRQRVSGHDEPRDVQVDVAGIDQVTLLVEPGVELDLADHADWCDARFIRLKE
ncbi:MAG: NPCBM/NEW2 domain-containing protein [Planctomycetes bacterium]|nr:NPCBM/NEW2 domain-containing protein [Planctomycetota bacterium]